MIGELQRQVAIEQVRDMHRRAARQGRAAPRKRRRQRFVGRVAIVLREVRRLANVSVP